MINVEQTIISQYGTSATITGLIRRMNDAIDPRADLDAFFDTVWNVETARGFGLDIWGRIVGVGRALTVAVAIDNFGFAEGVSYFPFDDGTFYAGEVDGTQSYLLGDDAYRRLILAKALGNISRCTASAVNKLIGNLFSDRGKCYVNDMGNMSMRYVFEFILTPVENAILAQSNVLPKPAGVQVTTLIVDTALFGFYEAGDAYPFDDGVFI